MSTEHRTISVWTILALFLVLVIIVGGVIIWLRYDPGDPVEITPAAPKSFIGSVYVGGEVNRPGIYPLREGDTLDDLLRAAGGTTGNADDGRIEITIPSLSTSDTSQKIDINRADAWLLAALPGIGEERARAIVDYRAGHGPFHDVEELLKVPGIGPATLEDIRDLIAVTD